MIHDEMIGSNDPGLLAWKSSWQQDISFCLLVGIILINQFEVFLGVKQYETYDIVQQPNAKKAFVWTRLMGTVRVVDAWNTCELILLFSCYRRELPRQKLLGYGISQTVKLCMFFFSHFSQVLKEPLPPEKQ